MNIGFWNGESTALKTFKVSPFDRGTFFGDGVYEVLRVYDGIPFLMQEHLTRLRTSLDSVRINYNVEKVEQAILSVISENQLSDGYVYLHITRGSGARSHAFVKNMEPNFFIYCDAYPADGDKKQGIRVITCEDTRWKNCFIKSLNLLPNCLAKQEAAEKGCQEAIFVNDEGLVTEGGSSNIFAVMQGKLCTHPASRRILNGITRQFVLKLAKLEGIPSEEKAFTVPELLSASEVFITSTSAEILNVATVNGTPIGAGPGTWPISARLSARFEDERKKLA